MLNSTVIHQSSSQPQPQSSPIKCYLKLYQSSGLPSTQSHPPPQFQILDQNTLLHKSHTSSHSQYQMYPFTKIFSARISNHLMARHLDMMDDLCQGINHTKLFIVDQLTSKFLVTGSLQHWGLFLEEFRMFYAEMAGYNRATVYVSLFSTLQAKPNQYIDLLTGQRYTFLAKKDFQSPYKTFYQTKIESLQEYLIALKIAMIRYGQCCSDMDFLVYRVAVLNQDEFGEQNGKTVGVGNVVICNRRNRNLELFLKQVQTLVSHSGKAAQQKISDHGSLYSCLEEYLRNGKISIMQVFLNEQTGLEASLEEIKRLPQIFMAKSSYFQYNKQPLSLKNFISNLRSQSFSNTQKLSPKTTEDPSQLSVSNLFFIKQLKQLKSIFTGSISNKEFEKMGNIFQGYRHFIKDTFNKIESYLKFYRQIIQIRDNFYIKEMFPVGLEIKDFQDAAFTIKSFYIAKIYSLSQKFQMQDVEPICDKMMTIRNQLQISLKSLQSQLGKSSKSIVNSQSNPLNNSVALIHSNSSKTHLINANKNSREQSVNNSSMVSQQQSLLQKSDRLARVLRTQLQKIKRNLRYVLNLHPRLVSKAGNLTKSRAHMKSEKNIGMELDGVDLGELLAVKIVQEIQKGIKAVQNKGNTNGRSAEKEEIRIDTRIQDNTDNSNIPQQRRHKKETSHQQSRMLLPHCTSPVPNLSSHPLTKPITIIKPLTIKRQKYNRLKQSNFRAEDESLQKSLILIKESQAEKDRLIKESLEKWRKENLTDGLGEVGRENGVNENGNRKEVGKCDGIRKKDRRSIVRQVPVTNAKRQSDPQTLLKLEISQIHSKSPQIAKPSQQSSILRVHHNRPSQLPQIKSPQKSPKKEIYITSPHVQTNQTHNISPKLKKKQKGKLIIKKNLIQGQKQVSPRRYNKQNYDSVSREKSFLPDISIMCKRIV